MKLVEIRRNERVLAGWAAGWFFCVLAAYYAIRPVRDAYGVAEGTARLPRLFTATLVVLILVAPIYSQVVRRAGRRRTPLVAYGFFALNLVAFWIGFSTVAADRAGWLRGTFYVWVSVFNLYAVTIFWSACVELLTADQSKRLFGLLAAAGTLGGLVGSELGRAIVRATREPRHILLLSAALMTAAIVCSRRFRRTAEASNGTALSPKLSPPERSELRDAWAGLGDVFRSPYLAALAAWMVLTSVASTSIYMEMGQLAKEQLPDAAARTDWYARLNNYQNGLTLVGQSAAASWLMRRIGLGATLAILPGVYCLGFAAIARGPSLGLLGLIDVCQRVASFAFGVPAREVLFTAVAPDEKYRAKALIDSVGKRAGDAAAAHLFVAAKAQAFTPAASAFVMGLVSALLAALGFLLAAGHKRRTAAGSTS
jgi:AAA family ATP:ADP antiporter